MMSYLCCLANAAAAAAAAAAAVAAAAGGRHITSRIKVEMHAFWEALEWLANTILFVWVSDTATPLVRLQVVVAAVSVSCDSRLAGAGVARQHHPLRVGEWDGSTTGAASSCCSCVDVL
jgi:hypothetical protein